MDNQQRLEQALGLEYSVAVRRNGTGYVLFIRELGLRHECSDLATGHVALLEMKNEWIRDLAREGLWDWIVPPGAAPAEQGQTAGQLRALLPFFVKFFCVALMLIVTLGTIANGLRDIGYALEKKIDGVLAMPADKLEANRLRARAVAERLGPIVRELMVMFHPEAPAVGQSSDLSAPSGRTDSARQSDEAR